MSARGGLSLIEVVFAILILAWCAAVAVPAYVTREPPDPAVATAERIAAILTSAARASAIRDTEVTLLIDPARRRYVVESIARDGAVVISDDSPSRAARAPCASLRVRRACARFVMMVC